MKTNIDFNFNNTQKIIFAPPIKKDESKLTGRRIKIKGKDYIQFSNSEPYERVAKAVFGGILDDERPWAWRAINASYGFRNFGIYTDIKFPIPERGEKIYFDDGLVIYEKNGITSTIYAIERVHNSINITERIEFIGEGSDRIHDFSLMWWCGNGTFCRDA